MPYDGTAWTESEPTNATLASEIDDVARDMKIGIRSRMATEHYWTSSQTATSEAGQHTYITLRGQTGAPTLPVVASTTQLAAIWCSSGSKHVLIEDSAGSSYILMRSGLGINVVSGVYSTTGTAGEMIIGTSGGTFKILAPGSSGQVLTASTTADVIWASNAAMFSEIRNYGASLTTGTSITNTNCKMYVGRATLSSGTATISGLPFTNATSYTIQLTLVSTFHSESPCATDVAAGNFTIRHDVGASDVISWTVIGT